MEPDGDVDADMGELTPEAQQMLAGMLQQAQGEAPGEPSPMSAVLEASEAGNLQAMVESLDSYGLDINEKGDEGDTALHIGCLYGHLAIVQECLRRGATATATDEDGSTPLHDASAGGYYEIAKLLLEHGALVDAFDGDGDSPLHLAANGGHGNVAELLLLRAGAERRTSLLSTANSSGYKPVDLAEDPALVAQLRLEESAEDEASVGAAFKKGRA
jgi:ankyrin repeat protein